MSDHKIMGGCSILLAKLNKKCIFRDRKSLEKGAVLAEKSYQKGVKVIKK